MRTPSATSTTSLSKTMESVKVVVRCRPLNEKEVEQGHEGCVEMFPDRGLIEIRNPNLGPTDPMKTFTFDAVYDCNGKQLDLYAETFAPLVDSVLDGFNGTIFAYGQTGSGKTFTVTANTHDSVRDLFGQIPAGMSFFMSFYEIYDGKVRDLLNSKSVLQVQEDGKGKIQISGLTERPAQSE